MVYYITTLLVYGGVDAIACLGLSQQFGVAGVTNFGFIIFQAAGAYAAAVLSLPPDSANGAFQSYVGGLNLPFPLPLIGAAVVGGLLSVPFAAIVGRRLRGDFAAVGLLVTAVMFNLLVTNYVPFLNGAAGLSLVPSPLQDVINPQSSGYQWGYSAVAVLLAFVTYRFVRRITNSPYGRTLRAMRDNDIVADSLVKNLRRTPRRLHQPLGPAGLGLCRDDRPVCRRDHRRARQPPGRGPRGDRRAVGLRGGHALHTAGPQRPGPGPRAAMGGHRAADRVLPVVSTAGHPA